MFDDWPFFAVLATVFGIGSCTGCVVNEAYHDKQVAIPAAVVDTAFHERFDKLEERIVQMSVGRCMNVTTPVLNIQIYDVPNLGKHKVPEPGRKVENEKPTN